IDLRVRRIIREWLRPNIDSIDPDLVAPLIAPGERADTAHVGSQQADHRVGGALLGQVGSWLQREARSTDGCCERSENACELMRRVSSSRMTSVSRTLR